MSLSSYFIWLKNDVPENKKGSFAGWKCSLYESLMHCVGVPTPSLLPYYCAKFSVFKFAMAFRLVRKGWDDLISGYWLAPGASNVCPEVYICMLNIKNDLLIFSYVSHHG